MKRIEKRVSKEEFEKFIKSYPRKLSMDVCAIAEPPLITYNDFTLGKFPDCIVARRWAVSDNPNDYFYNPNPKYFIMEFIDEKI